MKEVSCRIVIGALDMGALVGLTRAELLRGVPLPETYLLNPRNRVDWAHFALTLENLHDKIGDDGLLRVNREFGRTQTMGYVGLLANLVASPRALYALCDRWIGPSNYSHLRAKTEWFPDGSFRTELTIPEPYQPCRVFFLATIATYECLPTLLGLPAARVEAEITPRRAVYRVYPPPSGTIWARLKNRIQAVRGAGGFVEMLQHQQQELTDSLALATRQKQDFERLLGTISDGVVLLHEGRVHFANAALATTFGVPDATALQTREFVGWVAAADRTKWSDLLAAPDAAPCDLRFVSVDGAEVTCEAAVHGTVLFANFESRLVVLRDVTERRELEVALATTARRERATVAHDIHDGAGQLLAGAVLKATVLEAKLTRAAAAEAPLAAEVAELVKECGQQLREMAHTLSPVHLESRGFEPAIRQLAATTARIFEVECVVAQTGAGTPRLTSEAAMEVFRIVQESLHNAVRHGRARRLRVALHPGAGGIWCEVDDDGTGFAEGDSAKGGLGLKLMRHRAASFGGRVEFCRSSLGGAQVRCFVPGALWDAVVVGAADTPALPTAAAGRGVCRVLLADDHPVFRSGLAALLGQEPDLIVCGEVAELAQIGPACQREQPDALVTDLLFGEELALTELAKLHRAQPEVRIVVVSMFPESGYSGQARAAGATTYIGKQAAPADIVAAVRGSALSRAT